MSIEMQAVTSDLSHPSPAEVRALLLFYSQFSHPFHVCPQMCKALITSSHCSCA